MKAKILQKNIPTGWKAEKFNSHIVLAYGSSLPESKRINGDTPVYGSNGVVGSHTDYLVKGPGIIVGRKGTIGAVTWSESNFWPIDTTYYIEKDESIDLRWLYYKLQTLGLSKMNSASGTPGLNREEVYKLDITIPAKFEQGKTAEILSSVDEEIKKVEEIISATEKLKSGLVEKLFSGVSSKVKLSEISSLITKGTTPTTYGHSFTDEGINFFKIENINESGNIDLSSCKRISEGTHQFLKRSQLEDGDVLFSIAGALGRIAVIEAFHLPANINQAIAIIRLKNKKDAGFVSQVLKTDYVKKQVVGSSVQLAQANISLGKLGEIVIPWPRAEERQKISSIIQSIDLKIVINKKIRLKLLLLKKGLMQDLLTGKVRTI
jgi:type I restriction enzyme S subunit